MTKKKTPEAATARLKVTQTGSPIRRAPDQRALPRVARL